MSGFSLFNIQAVTQIVANSGITLVSSGKDGTGIVTLGIDPNTLGAVTSFMGRTATAAVLKYEDITSVLGGPPGTVTSVSIAFANGITGTTGGTVAAPILTIGTSITGMMKGLAGAFASASDGTDYTSPNGPATLKNKTVDLTFNTLTGTTAQFNAALSDGDFATLNNSVTLTNKTLTNPVINGFTGNDSVINIGSGYTTLYKHTSGNLSIGSTFYGWAGYNSVQIGDRSALYGGVVAIGMGPSLFEGGLVYNAYFRGDQIWASLYGGAAGKANFDDAGNFSVSVSGSNITGFPVSWTTPFTVSGGGDVTVGGGGGRLIAYGGANISGGSGLIVTGNVGIGVAAASFPFHLASSTGGIVAQYANADALGGSVSLTKARGSVYSPTAVLANDSLGIFGAGGYATTTYGYNRAAVQMYAAENWADAATGTYVTISTTPTGSVTRAERLRIDAAGIIGINATASSLWGSLYKAVSFSDDYCSLYHRPSNGAFGLASNFYKDGAAADRYKTSAGAAAVGLSSIAVALAVYPSGTAGNTLSAASTSLTLNNSGLVDVVGITRSAGYSLSGTGVTGGTTAFSAGTISTDANWGMHFRAPTGSAALYNYAFKNSSDISLMLIDASGNVGIGTASPGSKLETYASSNSLQIISQVRNDQSGTGVAAIGFNVSATAAADTSAAKAGIGLVRSNVQGVGSLVFYNRSTTDTSSFTTADEKMRLDSSGNLGIGVTPNYKLDVLANADAIGVNIRGRSADGIGVLRVANNSNTETFRLDARPTGTYLTVNGVNAFYSDTSGNVNLANSVWTFGATGVASASYTSSYTPQVQLFNNAADATGPYFIGIKGRASGTTSQNGDALAQFIGWGRFATNNTAGGGAGISIVQTSAATTTRVPASISFYTDNGTDTNSRMYVYHDGTVLIGMTVPLANAGDLQISKGIRFPATQVPQADVNTLDDYEEGSWTPSLGGTTTYTVQVGRYTKIGNKVFVEGTLQINAIGTGNTTTISGLPFTANSSNPGGGINCTYFSGLATAVDSLNGLIGANTATIALYSVTGTGGATAVTGPAVFASATVLYFNGQYSV